jgi:hypothetical protein
MSRISENGRGTCAPAYFKIQISRGPGFFLDFSPLTNRLGAAAGVIGCDRFGVPLRAFRLRGENRWEWKVVERPKKSRMARQR